MIITTPCSTFLFFEQLSQKLTNFNNIWYVKSWENLTSTCYTFLHLTCQMLSLFTLENQKQSFFKNIIHKCFRLFTLFKKKTKLQLLHCSLAVYLLFLCASHYLHSPITASAHATGGAHVSSTSPRSGWVAAAACYDMAEFQHSVMYNAIDQW